MDRDSLTKTCAGRGEQKGSAIFTPCRNSDDAFRAKCRRCLFAAARLVCQERECRKANRARALGGALC